MPDELVYEKGLMPDDTREALETMGHALTARKSLGRLMGITIDAEKGVYVGASDSSSPDGAALGYYQLLPVKAPSCQCASELMFLLFNKSLCNYFLPGN